MIDSGYLREKSADDRDVGRKRWWEQEVLGLTTVRAESAATEAEGGGKNIRRYKQRD